MKRFYTPQLRRKRKTDPVEIHQKYTPLEFGSKFAGLGNREIIFFFRWIQRC